MELRPLSEIESRPIDWLWPGRLGLGKPAVLDGDPGLGKSLVTLDLCARLSTGRPFPDDAPGPGVANSVVLTAEDSARDTVRPRLEVLGADIQRVFVIDPEHAAREGLISLPSKIETLDRIVANAQARLLVIDPFLAFLDAGFGMDNQTIRRAMLPLAQLAERRRCALLLVRHLNKGSGTRAIYRGGGAIGLVGACRSAWLVEGDALEPGRRVLAQIKNNLAPPQPSLAFRVVISEDNNRPPTLTWLGPVSASADQLLALRSQIRPHPALDRAGDFLVEFLRAGPRTSREIWTAVRRRQLGKGTIERAKTERKIRSAFVSVDGRPVSYWLLPDQNLPESVRPQVPDLEEWLAPLREKYPPSTPLDDL